jgi:hypothetical protein
MATLRNGPVLLVNFRVTTWISSANGDTATISPSTKDPIHLIEVENMSPVNRNCCVVGKLPNGAISLSFYDGGSGTDSWRKEIPSMSPNAPPRVRDCPLNHVRESRVPEPVRCEEVWSKRGNGNWVSETGKIPFGVHITVQK